MQGTEYRLQIFEKEIKVDINNYKNIPNIKNQIIKICPMTKSAFCRIKVPQELIDNLNLYLDKLYNDPNAISHANKLVGAIKMLNGNRVFEEPSLLTYIKDEYFVPNIFFIIRRQAKRSLPLPVYPPPRDGHTGRVKIPAS